MKPKFLLGLLLLMGLSAFTQGQFKVRNDAFIQIGYSGYKALTFGQELLTPNNGKFAIEYCDGCTPAGFNIWKPWPTWNYANYLLFIRDNGNVGIGNPGDASYKLNVSGFVRANAYHTFSDARLKTNVLPVDITLEKIMAMKPYQYSYRAPDKSAVRDSSSVNVSKRYVETLSDPSVHYGLLAQDVEALFPHLVQKDEKGMMSINYIEIIPLLIKAMQEQNQRIKYLEAAIQQSKDLNYKN